MFILSNYTLDQIPIDRLTASDIRQQSGGIVAVVIVCIVLLIVVSGKNARGELHANLETRMSRLSINSES